MISLTDKYITLNKNLKQLHNIIQLTLKILTNIYFEKVSSPGNLLLLNINAFKGSDCVVSSNKFELIEMSDSEILSKIKSSDF